MTLGEKIRTARGKAHLKPSELAEKVGVSERAVRFWESDQRVPDFLNVYKIAQATNTPLDFFTP